jgi:anthranilate/para-aminobenzoate synthase component II
MAVRHVAYPLTGVQFHPESILTRPGHRLLQNFLEDDATATAVKIRVA